MRLDKFLTEKGYAESRNRASILLEKGLVLVNGSRQKASYEVKEEDEIILTEQIKYVSMGGYKLEKAVIDFSLDLKDKTCADIGCSKGGFSQVMLNGGAKKVYAVDVSISELDENLKANNKVNTIEINAKNITEQTFGEKVDFIAVDCSFISIKHILQNLINVLKSSGSMVVLLKPQFECGQENLTKNGIVKNKKILSKICNDFIEFFNLQNLKILNFTFAPLRDNKNVEFLFYLAFTGNNISEKNIQGILSKL